MDQVRETYEVELDAKYAAARGFVDAVIMPEDTRDALELSLRTPELAAAPRRVRPPDWMGYRFASTRSSWW